MYSFLLTLTKTDARLELLKDGEQVALKNWAESRDMGRQLFQGIQSLLTEAGLDPAQVTDFRLDTDVSDNFMSVKIAQTVQQVFLFAVTNIKKLESRVSPSSVIASKTQ